MSKVLRLGARNKGTFSRAARFRTIEKSSGEKDKDLGSSMLTPMSVCLPLNLMLYYIPGNYSCKSGCVNIKLDLWAASSLACWRRSRIRNIQWLWGEFFTTLASRVCVRRSSCLIACLLLLAGLLHVSS